MTKQFLPERHEELDQMLDECYPSFMIGEMTFYPSDILYNCDPIAYAISASEYEDNLEENENN